MVNETTFSSTESNSYRILLKFYAFSDCLEFKTKCWRANQPFSLEGSK